MSKKLMERKPVLVTTEFRGVFFGYIKDDKKLPAQITLIDARNCMYWSPSCGGFLGLAVTGPNKECKIGRCVSEITLYKITSVSNVESKAEIAWRDI